MKFPKTAPLALVTLALALPATGFAGNKNNTNYLNGKPFAALSAQIQQNAVAINDLEMETAAFRAALSAIETDIGDLEQQVETNRADLESLVASLSDVSTQVAYNRSELESLKEQHVTDMAAVESEMAALDERLSALQVELAAALSSLSDQLTQLKAELEVNSGSIDSLLTDVASLMTEVMGLNLRLDTGEARMTSLEDDLAGLDQLVAELDASITSLTGRVTALESTQDQPALTLFSGIQTNVPASSLEGWESCYVDTYGTQTDWSAVMNNQCTKPNLMMACRRTGSDDLIVAAQGQRQDVLFETGINRNQTHVANGVAWYYNNRYSWGFAEPGDGVYKWACDTAQGQHPESRLCWHTQANFTAGYRCGIHTGLNRSAQFERVLYQAD